VNVELTGKNETLRQTTLAHGTATINSFAVASAYSDRIALQPGLSVLTLRARVVYYTHGCHTIGPPPAAPFSRRSQYFLNKQRPII
jgi:hypothetical protein